MKLNIYLYRWFVGRYLLPYDVLFFICHMIITLDTLCFLLLFVLHSSQCSCSFLGQQLKVMTLFYEQIFGVNIDSIYSNVKKKTLTLINRCMHLKKSFNSSWGEETGNNANPADVTAKMKRLRWANGHK